MALQPELDDTSVNGAIDAEPDEGDDIGIMSFESEDSPLESEDDEEDNEEGNDE